VTLSDEIWKVIVEHHIKYDNIEYTNKDKQIVEQNTLIIPFDGGIFIVKDNEFDLFVLPKKRGKWRIKHEVNKLLAYLAETYDVAKIRINSKNKVSLRLALFFGFKEVKLVNDVIELEKKLWAE
jgi:hypothetical protein